MFKIQTLIFFALISFSLQDSNCLVYYEKCEEQEEAYPVKIANCKFGYLDDDGKEICDECNSGFAISDEYNNCTKVDNTIENCIEYKLKDGKFVCSKCKDGYIRSDDQKKCRESKNCYRFQLNENGEEICDGCEKGYVLSNDKKSCIQFENCIILDEKDEKCIDCDEYFHPNANGKCERTQCEVYDDNNNNVCTTCYQGYYPNDDGKCEKIPVENCLKFDSSRNKCVICLGDINPDSDGKCNLPSPLIKGCIKYGSDKKCTECINEGEDYELTAGTCKVIDCKDGKKKYEYCLACKAGYYMEWDGERDDYICIGYDGSMDTSSSDSSSRNTVEYALLIFILAFLI